MSLEQTLPKPGPALQAIAIGELDTSIIESSAHFTTQQAEFEGWVERIREYILDGDVMQVVPSQRMSIDFDRQPISLYRALRNLNPSPYMYFLDMGDFQIVGSSPEILVRSEQGTGDRSSYCGHKKARENRARR